MQDELIWSAVVAWMTAKALEIAKTRLAFVPLDATTERLNYWASRVLAAVAAVGVHASFDADAGVLTITGLTVSGLFGATLEYARQLMFQEIAWKKFIKAPKET